MKGGVGGAGETPRTRSRRLTGPKSFHHSSSSKRRGDASGHDGKGSRERGRRKLSAGVKRGGGGNGDVSSAGAFAPDPFAGVGVEELAESWMEMHDTDGDGKLSLHELQASQEAGMGGGAGGL